MPAAQFYSGQTVACMVSHRGLGPEPGDKLTVAEASYSEVFQDTKLRFVEIPSCSFLGTNFTDYKDYLNR